MLADMEQIGHSWWFAFTFGAASGVAAMSWVGDLVAGLPEKRRARRPQIELSFDPSNADGYSWFSESTDSLLMANETVDGVQYCVKLTNNTNRTISNIKATKMYWGQQKEEVKFVRSGNTTCELHPGGTDYAMIICVSPENEELDHDIFPENYSPRRSFGLFVGATHVPEIKATIHVDVTQRPAIRLEVHKCGIM